MLIPTLAFKSNDSKQVQENRAIELLKGVGLDGHMYHRPGQLSGGEQQRVAVMRALINSPKLILADEQTGSLDQTAADNLGELLVTLNKEENLTLIVVTHSSKLAKHMDKIYHLSEGRLES